MKKLVFLVFLSCSVSAFPEKTLIQEKNTRKPQTVPGETVTESAPQFNAKKLSSAEKLPQASIEYGTIEWLELIPQTDLDILMNPPDYITDIEDDEFERQVSDQVKNALNGDFDALPDDDYQRALVSTAVIDEMDNKNIRIPGFVVPLTYDDKQAITSFFLVPFFGACIHVPPPPPNQIIFVSYTTGLELADIRAPIWIKGTLKTALVENGVATSAYSLTMVDYEDYTD